MRRIFIVISAAGFLCGCSRSSPASMSSGLTWKRDTTVHYAKRFSIAVSGARTLVCLFSGINSLDTTGVFHLVNGSAGHPGEISAPCKKIAALSCIYAQMLSELGLTESLAAIDNVDYVSNPLILERHRSGRLPELARTPEIDVERTLALKPDLVLAFGAEAGEDRKLAAAGIPFALCADHLEESPLARAEWIKLFGTLAGKRLAADSIFRETERRYREVAARASELLERPAVFTEMRFGDTWYMPGGKSYIATLIADAGGDYLWKDQPRAGSIPLSFEQVYAKAATGDIWLHTGLLRTKQALEKEDRRYRAFKAFRLGNVYNNTKRVNENGYSEYWESGMLHPERILADLARIFHPSLRQELGNDLYYYEKLK